MTDRATGEELTGWPLVARSTRPFGARPSYLYKLKETQRRRMVLRAIGSRDPAHLIDDKLAAYRLAESLGLGHPDVHGEWASIEDVDPLALPHRFVLKPVWGFSNKGVFALERVGNMRYRDHLTGRDVVWQDVLAEFADIRANHGIKGRVFAEEIVSGPAVGDLAYDWKLHAFYGGEVPVIMQRDLRGSPNMDDWRFKFWSESFEDLGPVKFFERLDPNLPAPIDPDGLLWAARTIMQALPVAFLRIDLMEHPRKGPILGELTPIPGSMEHVPDVDQMLGEAWERAEAHLMVADRNPLHMKRYLEEAGA